MSAPPPTPRGRGRRLSYWALAVLLIAFGVLAILSIGLPFLATGLALVALAPLRDRPGVFWPWLAGVVALFVGYVLVAPLACSARESATAAGSDRPDAAEVGADGVTCMNLAGIDYTGGPGYDPPLWPAAIAGVITALGAGAATRIAVAGRARRSRPPRHAARD